MVVLKCVGTSSEATAREVTAADFHMVMQVVVAAVVALVVVPAVVVALVVAVLLLHLLQALKETCVATFGEAYARVVTVAASRMEMHLGRKVQMEKAMAKVQMEKATAKLQMEQMEKVETGKAMGSDRGTGSALSAESTSSPREMHASSVVWAVMVKKVQAKASLKHHLRLTSTLKFCGSDLGLKWVCRQSARRCRASGGITSFSMRAGDRLEHFCPRPSLKSRRGSTLRQSRMLSFGISLKVRMGRFPGRQLGWWRRGTVALASTAMGALK